LAPATGNLRSSSTRPTRGRGSFASSPATAVAPPRKPKAASEATTNKAHRPPLCLRRPDSRNRGVASMGRVHLLPRLPLVVLVIGLATANVTAQQEPHPATQQEFLERLAALAKTAPPPEPVGEHVIRGRVVTTTGEPLAGVDIYATTTKDLYGPRD